MGRLVDLVTARALRYALEPGPIRGRAAAELALLARGDDRILNRALSRVERGQAERSSRTGQRARDALQRALRLLRDDP